LIYVEPYIVPDLGDKRFNMVLPDTQANSAWPSVGEHMQCTMSTGDGKGRNGKFCVDIAWLPGQLNESAI